MSRLDRKRGRFDTTYETGLADDAMLDFQDVNGDWMEYYRYAPEQSTMHPIYDEPIGRGRVFTGPLRIPVLSFSRSEGSSDFTPGGLYWTDTAHLVIPFAGLEAAGLDRSDVEHGKYLSDRIVYDDRVFRITAINVLGQVRQRDWVAGVDLVQLKPEDLRGDRQFSKWHRTEQQPLLPENLANSSSAPPVTVVPTYPTGATTGYAAAGYTTPTQVFADTSITVNGTVVHNKIVTGQIAIYADNVVFEGCEFTAAGQNGQIKLRAGYGGLIVRDCNMGGNGSDLTQYCIVADDIPVGNPVIIQRNRMTRWSDALQINGHGGALIENNYIADCVYFAGDHTDGFQANGGAWNMTIRHNTIEVSLSQTGCIALFQDFPNPYDNILVEDNLLAGGGYSLYCVPSQATNCRYINNRFSTKFYPAGGLFGPMRDFQSGNGNVWSGNVWHDGPNAGVAIQPA